MTDRMLTAAAPLSPAPRSAHLVGIGGAGMKALAELLTGQGWRVTGSDSKQSETLSQMRKLGWRVHTGHDDSFLPAETSLLIHSSAVEAANAERIEASRRGIPQRSLSVMLGELMASKIGVAVAGTHGKSTTTAMVATLLKVAGRRPSAYLGAEFCATGRSALAGPGEHFVVEACEYRRNFLALQPRHALLLGIESDHFDCFADAEAYAAAFREFVGNIPNDGTLVARGDCAITREILREAKCRCVTYSGDMATGQPDCDYRSADVRPVAGGSRFRVFHAGEFLAEVTLRVGGKHNVANALAATALCRELGLSASEIRDGLWEFTGIRRRFEMAGSWRGRTLVDDYAHHPTAVRAVLDACREQFPGRRICCVFQPHQVSRTTALIDSFAESLTRADATLVLPVFRAREDGLVPEPAVPGLTVPSDDHAVTLSRRLAKMVSSAGRPAEFLPSLDLVPDAVDHVSRPGDVLVTLGAGDIDRVHHEFSRRLRRHHAAG